MLLWPILRDDHNLIIKNDYLLFYGHPAFQSAWHKEYRMSRIPCYSASAPMTGSPKVNLFHCLGKFYVALEKLIYDRGSINPLFRRDFLYKSWNFLIKINWNVQLQIRMIKLTSFTFWKIIFFSHGYPPYVLVSCFVSFRLEIILISTALSLSSRNVWIKISKRPFSEIPIVIHLSSVSLWSESNKDSACESLNTVVASSKVTPCLSRLSCGIVAWWNAGWDIQFSWAYRSDGWPVPWSVRRAPLFYGDEAPGPVCQWPVPAASWCGVWPEAVNRQTDSQLGSRPPELRNGGRFYSLLSFLFPVDEAALPICPEWWVRLQWHCLLSGPTDSPHYPDSPMHIRHRSPTPGVSPGRIDRSLCTDTVDHSGMLPGQWDSRGGLTPPIQSPFPPHLLCSPQDRNHRNGVKSILGLFKLNLETFPFCGPNLYLRGRAIA